MPEQVESYEELKPDWEAVVASVSAQVLETMFFEEAVPAPCDHSWIESAVSARVRFDGSHCGEFLLSASPTTTRSVASGFMGLSDHELNESEPGQVILELTNILCGAVMSSLWPDSSLSLTSPELISSDYSLAGDVHRCFALPDGSVGVTLRMCRQAG